MQICMLFRRLPQGYWVRSPNRSKSESLTLSQTLPFHFMAHLYEYVEGTHLIMILALFMNGYVVVHLQQKGRG